MSQKTDKMLKLALVFFISLLSFSIGTFVGKKYSDNQHKLAQLEPQKNKDVAEHDFASTTDGKSETAPGTKDGADPLLTDNEVAKIAEEFATETESEIDTKLEKTIGTAASEEKEIKEITATVKTTAQPRPLPAMASKNTARSAAAAPKANLATAQSPAPVTTAAKVREVASIPPGAGQYTVQVGSFPTHGEAQKLSQDLMNKGFKSSSVPAQVNGQTWHRVHVGLFGSVKEAQDYKKDFLEKTKLTAAIVQRVK